MSSVNGFKYKLFPAIALFILLLLPKKACCQVGILDSTFTFRAGTVKTGNALDIITRRTGYNFTYDNRLINAEKKTELTFKDIKLRVILNNILLNDSLVLSVIDKYIIISHAKKLLPSKADSISAGNVSYITGVIIDDETRDPAAICHNSIKKQGKRNRIEQ